MRGFKYHKNLCPDIWDSSNNVDPLVAQAAQMAAWDFVHYLQFLGVPLAKTDIVDIILHGSTTNYYWDNKSDVDIPKHHSLIYNPTVYISNNNIVIEGKEDVTIYCDSITYLTDLVYPPQMEYIKYDKGITIFGHKFFESPCYVKRGWYRSEPILDVKYILNQCVIKIIK